MTTAASFAHGLARFGAATALVCEDGQTVSYADLADRVDAFAARLAREGLEPGSVLLLLARSTTHAIVAYLACLRAGYPLALLEPSVPPAQVEALVRSLGVRAVLDADGGIAVTGEPARPVRADLSLLLSTSGSTGNPKSVMLSLGNLQANAESIAAYLPIVPEDVAITVLPLPYSYGLSVLNSHLLRGARVVVTGEPLAGKAFWSLVRAHGVTSLPGVPFSYQMLRMLRFERMDLPALRYLTQAGGRLSPDLTAYVRGWSRETGKPVYLMYGQTEATARMAYLRPELLEAHGDCIGEAIPGGAFFLRDPETGAVLEEEGATGELCYRGPNVMLGYAERAEDLAGDRRLEELATGDLAERLPSGLFRITGRKKRIVKIQGKRWQLDHVEAELARRGIEALATGRDDKLRVAVVDRDPGSAAASATRRWLQDEQHLHPSLFEVVRLAEVPRTANGKVDYPAVLAYEGARTP
jgi:acyl-CoA synthetase (AMP-forming)/AMP-acid ligase II